MTIPVTLVGGYLGSGKTTRVNDLLVGWQGPPVAVVVNDFGAVNIDAELLRSAGAGEVVELENGCICCSLADGMPTVLRQLRERAPAHVLMELSGVALPGTARSWAGYPGFALHAVVVCVDVSTIEQRLADRWIGDVVADQLRGADELLLTCTDLVSTTTLELVVERLGEVAPQARFSTRTLSEVVHGAVPVGSGDTASTNVTAIAPGTTIPRDPTSGHAAHVTRTLVEPPAADRAQLEAWLAARPDGVVRVKGHLPRSSTDAAEELTWFVQLAGDRIIIEATSREAGDNGRYAPALVAIALPGTDPATVEAWFASL